MRPPRSPRKKHWDRLWWVLAGGGAIAIVAVLWLSHRAEDQAVEWISNPYGVPETAPPAAPEPTAPAATDTSTVDSSAAVAADSSRARRSAERAPAAEARRARPDVTLLTTPAHVSVGAMTPGCQQVLKTRGPWKDAATATPWPECIDREGRPMVVQFCSYIRVAGGDWTPSENTRNAPRCRAELADVRSGKVRGATSR
ncbi:MAG TPA: hypothetical protein VFW66_00460 [Gemmatimonadales bacterium]|nr:hypothetical protein [Gemmatimonadales bacterium]